MGLWQFLFIFLGCYALSVRSQSGQKRNSLEELSDHQAFKQLLRTRTNVLVLFMKRLSESASIYKSCREAAAGIKGIGTIVAVDCDNAGNKLCKKLKATPDPHLLQHYKDGKFNKVYDRKETAKSLIRFMNDPTGDIPWEEEPSGKSVIHLETPDNLDRLIKKNKPVLVMFYAPWCVYCKQMKPEFASAAAKVKTNGDGILAAMDVMRPENIPIRSKYNISGFPTLYYFRKGKAVKTYDGDNKEDKIIEFMKNPDSVVVSTKEADWADSDTDVVHLTQDNFDSVLQETKSVLIMFYAPWCGHCKKMKPEYEKAAAQMKKDNIPGILAAVDSTKETSLSEKFGVRGFPSIKYFKDGEFVFNVPQLREVSKIVEFMKEPKEPPPEPPPEPAWSEVKSEVVHLTEENFKAQLRSKRNALVMFYAPWCGHCKQAKPEFTQAAEQLKDLPRTVLAAINCDEHRSLCKLNDIKGYPTFKYFRYYNKENPTDYNGGRNAKDFVKFMSQFEEMEYQTTTQPVIKEEESVKSFPAEIPEAKVPLGKDIKSPQSTGSTKPGAEKETKPSAEIKGTEFNERKSVKIDTEKLKTVDDFDWSKLEGGNKIIQINNENVKKILKQQPSIAVLFYTPWCQQCKELKPALVKAAQLAESGLGVFGVCDVSVAKTVADILLVKDLPTIKLFKNGVEKSTFSGPKTTENLLQFLKSNSDGKKDEL